jgi:hypothetical protein
VAAVIFLKVESQRGSSYCTVHGSEKDWISCCGCVSSVVFFPGLHRPDCFLTLMLLTGLLEQQRWLARPMVCEGQ